MNWHKRHALGLASQLPDNASDANAVNVDTWLHPAEEPLPSKVVTLVRDPSLKKTVEEHSPPVHAGGFLPH
jgi:hypothetical protein